MAMLIRLALILASRSFYLRGVYYAKLIKGSECSRVVVKRLQLVAWTSFVEVKSWESVVVGCLRWRVWCQWRRSEGKV